MIQKESNDEIMRNQNNNKKKRTVEFDKILEEMDSDEKGRQGLNDVKHGSSFSLLSAIER